MLNYKMPKDELNFYRVGFYVFINLGIIGNILRAILKW